MTLRVGLGGFERGSPFLAAQRYRHLTTKSGGVRREHTSASVLHNTSSVLPSASIASTSATGPASQRITEVDGMLRWPSLTSSGGVLRTMDWIGTVSFAHSGAILAATMGMDLLGTMAVGTITAVGGGTIRDALFLSRSPFWTNETEYLGLCAATALATFMLWPHVSERISDDHSALFAGDTVGIAAFCVIGAQNGIRAGMPPIVSVLCGMATATFGGVMRDVLCKRDVRIFHSHAEIYATTAAGGATAYLAARSLRAPVRYRIAVGLATAGTLRYMARKDGIRLPTWRKEHD